jgi:glyoxylase-like metal-dependent hydrolase (beta-lactamase superfamily II)
MADPQRRLEGNVAGDFYVDDTCIDCDLCRQIAPDSFDFGDGYSVVHQQPEDERQYRRAMMALAACPTASIGTLTKPDTSVLQTAFPEAIEDGVFFCGYASRDSFGGASYLITRKDGNVLVDSPRFARRLVNRIESMGGVSTMFLTHRDDVADHEKFHARFDADRVIHKAERIPVEHVIEGDAPVQLAPDLTAIPTPGHTRGHMVLLYRDRFLFTGDHLAYSPRYRQLIAFRRHNWHSWSETIRSMQRLLEFDFEWVLPGHGRRAFYPGDEMRRQLARCVAWMKQVA